MTRNEHISHNNNLMGAKDNLHKPAGAQSTQQQSALTSDHEESNQTSHQLPQMSLLGHHSQKTQPPDSSEHFSFLKNKPIRKRNKLTDNKEHLKGVIQKMDQRIQQLESLLQDYQSKENACPHCHFYLNATTPTPERALMSVEPLTPPSCNRSLSKESLEFEQIDFTTPLLGSPQMEEKSWIFLGTVMIAMGSKVMDMDGTVNVFKIVKESVDRIRRQVEKSEQRLSMDFFMSKQDFMPEGSNNKIDELGFDPFYSSSEPQGGLQLDGVRVQSVEEYELYFDQKLSFNVRYDSLITAMEYLKENSQLSFK